MSIRIARIAAATMLAAGAAVVGAGHAVAAPANVTIDGNMQLLGISVLHVDAKGSGNGPATGTYVATGRLGDAALPVKVSGPITCMTVNGNLVSLVYPISALEPVMIFQPDAMAVQVTVAKGAAGTPNRIGYGMPMPTSSFKGCDPGPTPMDFDGTIDIK